MLIKEKIIVKEEDYMVNLSKVTLEHAIEIIKAGYPTMMITNKDSWELEDVSSDLDEPASYLFSLQKVYSFYFTDDQISIHYDDNDIDLANNYDTRLSCYLKAYELGYDIPKITEFIRNNNF